MPQIHDRMTELIEALLIKKHRTKQPIVIPCKDRNEMACVRSAIYKYAKVIRTEAAAEGYTNELSISANDLLIRVKEEENTLIILNRDTVVGIKALENALTGDYKLDMNNPKDKTLQATIDKNLTLDLLEEMKEYNKENESNTEKYKASVAEADQANPNPFYNRG